MHLLAAAAIAASSIVADRPGFADGPATVGAGKVQIEIGVNREESDTTLPTLLRFGLTEALELRLEHEDDLSAGFKLRLRDGLSLLANVNGEDLQTEVRLLGEIDLGNELAFVPNVGVALAEGEGASAVVAASLEKEIGKAIPFVDFELRAGDGGTEAVVDGGVAWIVGTETQLDVAGGCAVDGDGCFITAGISRRF